MKLKSDVKFINSTSDSNLLFPLRKRAQPPFFKIVGCLCSRNIKYQLTLHAIKQNPAGKKEIKRAGIIKRSNA